MASLTSTKYATSKTRWEEIKKTPIKYRTSKGTATTWSERRVATAELRCQGQPERLCYRVGELVPETDYIIEVQYTIFITL